MSIKKYQQASRIIRCASEADFEGPKPESLVAKAEQILALRFPPSYRRFLLEWGCGDLKGLEVFGLIDDVFENSTAPNAIWLTLNKRASIGLDPGFVIVADVGDGTSYALDTRHIDDAGEAPVLRVSVDGCACERIADSFGAYLLEAVKAIV
jgi:hypothetical protein